MLPLIDIIQMISSVHIDAMEIKFEIKNFSFIEGKARQNSVFVVNIFGYHGHL